MSVLVSELQYDVADMSFQRRGEQTWENKICFQFCYSPYEGMFLSEKMFCICIYVDIFWLDDCWEIWVVLQEGKITL